jgi:hypothetical protein
MIRKLLLLLALLPSAAFAQSPTPSTIGPYAYPNWYRGYVPTPQEWAMWWSWKIDGNGIGGVPPANGQLLIGNGAGYTLNTLTAGSNVTITNGQGSIQIDAAGGAPGGASGNVQWNNAGAFDGNDGFTYDGTSAIGLGVSGTSVGAISLNNATTGSITLQPVTGALGSAVLSLPAATDTLVGKATTDTLTGKTYDTAGAGNVFKINGTAISAVNGTGAVVLTTNAALVTPDLGTPSAIALTNGSGLPVSGLASIAADTVVANGTGSSASPIAFSMPSCSSSSNALTWTSGSGFGCNSISGSGTVNSGTAGQLAYYATSSSAVSGNANVTVSAGALTLGQSGTAGSVILNGSSTGTITLAVPSAAGSNTITFPAATGTATVLGNTSTGSGNIVLATSPVLTTPNLGTPSAITLTSGTGLPVSTGISGLGTGIATWLATPSSANLASAITDETGSGALVFANTPSLTTPAIGAATGTSVSLTAGATVFNATAVPAGGNNADYLVKGSTTANLGVYFGSGAPTLSTAQGSLYIRSDGAPYYNSSSGSGTTWTQIGSGGSGLTVGSTTITSGTNTRVLFDNSGTLGEYTISGSGNVCMTTSCVMTTPNLGTPSAVTLTNGSGLPVSGVTGFGSGVSAFLVTPTSGNLAGAVTDETGSGALVFAASPTLSGTIGGSLTWSGAQTFSSSIKTTSIIETFSAPSITSNVLTIDLTQGTVFNVTNSANINTFTISNATASTAQAFTLVMTSNGSSRTQTWGSSVKWPGGTAPTLTATSGKVDVLTFVTNNGGTTWYGFVGGQNY